MDSKEDKRTLDLVLERAKEFPKGIIAVVPTELSDGDWESELESKMPILKEYIFEWKQPTKIEGILYITSEKVLHDAKYWHTVQCMIKYMSVYKVVTCD